MLYHVTFLGQIITIETSVDLVARWSEMMSPYMVVTEGLNERSDAYVVVKRKNFDGNALESSPELVKLHCGAVGFSRRHENTTTVHSPSLRVTYVLRRTSNVLFVDYMYQDFTEEVNLDLLRIVRGILDLLGQASGLRKVHMAVVSDNQYGAALIGPEGAGKTSFMLAFLAQVEQSSLVTNDKALMESVSKRILAYGLPYAVSVGDEALKRYPPVSSKLGPRRINGEIYYWPNEIVSSVNRSLSICAKLDFILAVEIDPDSNDLKASKVERSKEITDFFRNNVFAFSDQVSPDWLRPWIVQENANDTRTLESLSDLPMLRLQGNPWNGNLKRLWGSMLTHE